MKIVHGLKRDDSMILSEMRRYHNYVRPYMRLPDKQTPGDVAGISVEDNDKISGGQGRSPF